MTVLIDPPRWPAHGRVWSHLVSDQSYDELHAFAAAQDIPSRGFDHDHYDVPVERYQALVDAGAVPVDSRELLRRIGDAGLRQPKRDRRTRSAQENLTADTTPSSVDRKSGRPSPISSCPRLPPPR